MNNDSSESFTEILERHELRVQAKAAPVAAQYLPVEAGRQTVPEEAGTLGGLLQEYAQIDPDFPLQVFDALENLTKFHGEVSQAVDNIRQLGNTNWNVYFDDSVSDDMAKEMILRLRKKSKNWYAYSGGINSLINDLLGQIAVYGALSAEIVPTNQLDEVKKAVIVNPKNIIFKYNKATDEYEPYQKLKRNIAMDGSNTIKLNTVTYKYVALGRFGEKPYAIPPFIAALFNISIDRDMMSNMKYVIRKLGMLGFLEVLINGPKPNQGESDLNYFNRTKAYLSRVTPEIDKGLAKGYVVGFEGTHTFNMHNTGGNVQGAKDLMEMNDVKMMTGLKQDPLMFGRNFSTTETLGRVILAKMTTQVGNYQKTVASFLEQVFLIDLQLAGYKVTSLDVEFDAPMIGDKKRDAETRTIEIANTTALYNAGIISQQQRAVELGYEKPDEDEPRSLGLEPTNGNNDNSENPQGSDKTDPNADKTDKTDTESNVKLLIKKLEASLGKYSPEFPYDSHVGCGCGHHTFDGPVSIPDSIAGFIADYFTGTKKVYSKAYKVVLNKVANVLLEMTAGATQEDVLDKVIYTIYNSWGTEFTAPQKKVISKFVDSTYKFFRKDKTVFGEVVEGVKLPKGALSTIDYRALEYFKNSDSFYLGKFITDDDLNKKITKFIKDKYLTAELPIGNNKESMDAFKAEFGDIFEGKDWKINQIISTSVNRMRNTAAVSYMDEADVEEYEIRGVVDRLQCGYCKEMQGKKFSVKKAMENIDHLSKSSPELIKEDSPFVTSVFKSAAEIQKMTGPELQDKNINHPPFHTYCRDVVVAIL